MKDSVFSVIRDNLLYLSERKTQYEEQHRLLMTQLSKLLSSEQELTSPQQTAELLAYIQDAPPSSQDCLYLIDELEESGIWSPQVLFPDFPVPPGAHEKIALVRNHFNDHAFSHFSDLLPHAKASYYGDFRECCDAVMTEECEFAIIPIENATDGRLYRFYSLLDQYDLKIRSACDLETQNSQGNIRFALVAKSLEFPTDISEDTPCILEFHVSLDQNQNISDIFHAALYNGADIYRVDTLPMEDEQTRFYHAFLFSSKLSLTSFLLYLYMRFPQFTLQGIYYAV